jgi:glycosyltransferase involved in cell wall biosynthesis
VLRIGFDGRALDSPAAGVRRYTRQLFSALAALGPDLQVLAVGPAPAAGLPPGIDRVPAGPSLPTNVGWMLTGLPRAARQARVDVMHAPSYTAPVGGPRPLVLTIHDVSYERHPEWYPYRRDPLRRAFYRWSARTADRVITDSGFSKREIVAAYALAEDRIDVIPLAPAAVFQPTPAAPAPGSPYVLHVGDLHPRRNLELAVRAVLRVRERGGDLAGLRFVLAGVDRGGGPRLAAMGGAAVDLIGAARDETLAALYRGAAALVYPSLYEGFGLPLVEAMACGTPVIAARAASIPEVTGGAALLIDPADEAAWTDAIEGVARTGGPLAPRLRDAGLRRAAVFSWRRTAEATLDVYRRAIEARR